jgi:4-hydroxy-tetrahydrodipicolinate synthase
MPQLKGVYTALITPFNSNGSLDEEGLRDNIRDQITQGVAGVVALGTTGESPTLTDQEKVRVMQIAKEETANKIHLMAGTGSNSTEQSIRQSRLAEELGADSCLVINPYYNKPTQEGIYLHFKAVAESIQIPLIIYHHPGRTGSKITPETIIRLSDIPNIIGIKEASGDLATIAHWMEQLDPEFCLFSGDDTLTLPTMALGGHGVISVASNLVPSTMVRMVNAALQEDFKTARELHHLLVPLFRFLSVESNPIPLKAAMNQAGKAAGACRPPLTPLSESHIKLLKDSLPKVSHG